MISLGHAGRWTPLALLVLAQIAYPLVTGVIRAELTVLIVLLGYLASVGHALTTRGLPACVAVIAVSTGGGFAVEALGVATGWPFGQYAYTDALGPRLAGVPLIIPLAWTWMAWPAWLAARRLVHAGRLRTARRVGLAALGLAGWDLFLDPQMVAAGYWRWTPGSPALPGVPGVPVGNYLGWLAVSVLMMAALAATAGERAARAERGPDAPMLALFLWTYVSSVLAHALFLGLAGSAWWGGLGMGLVAVPLAITIGRRPMARPAGVPA